MIGNLSGRQRSCKTLNCIGLTFVLFCATQPGFRTVGERGRPA